VSIENLMTMLQKKETYTVKQAMKGVSRMMRRFIDGY